MWIEHIGEIAMVAFVVLILAHFGLHLFFKMQKRKRDKLNKNNQQQQNKD